MTDISTLEAVSWIIMRPTTRRRPSWMNCGPRRRLWGRCFGEESLMKNADYPPALSDFTTKAFGQNWHEVSGWRQPKPGSRPVTRKEMNKVIAAWRKAYKEWEAS